MMDQPVKHPFEARVQNIPGKRVLECWMIHLGGDYYLELSGGDTDNYLATKDMRRACRFAISEYNDRLTTQIVKRFTTQAINGRVGTPRRMLVRWPQGANVTPLNEVRG